MPSLHNLFLLAACEFIHSLNAGAHIADVLFVSNLSPSKFVLFSVSKKMKKARTALVGALNCLPFAEANDTKTGQTVNMIAATAAMGLVASGAAIGMSASRFETIELIGAGFLLASTSLATLACLVRKPNAAQFFLGNIATWIAVGSATAMHAPVTGLSTVAVALAAYFMSVSGEQYSNQHPDIVSLPEAPAFTEKLDCISIGANAEVKEAGTINGLFFAQGEKFIERVHVQDRVAFLRALSELALGETPRQELSLLVNTAAKNRTANFVCYDVVLSSQDDTINLSFREASDEPVQAAKPATDAPVPNILAIVSHELRTPLNAIIGFSQMLQGDVGKNLSEENRAEYAGLINGAGNHLLTLVNTILDVSKIESGSYAIHRDMFSFRDTARESIAMVAEQAKKRNIQINERFARDLDFANGDRRAVKQILINLLSNAVKYTGDNGFVTMDAFLKNGTLTFEVSDTGVGMDAPSLEKIGRPFAQVDSEYNRESEGTGLGLSLVKGLAELHGGSMAIHSSPDVGTRVIITIPPEKVQSETVSSDSASLVTLRAPSTVSNENDPQIAIEEITRDERKIG